MNKYLIVTLVALLAISANLVVEAGEFESQFVQKVVGVSCLFFTFTFTPPPPYFLKRRLFMSGHQHLANNNNKKTAKLGKHCQSAVSIYTFTK